MPDIDPGARFSSRVADYVRYRPSYPDALVDELAARCSLDGNSRIADLGSGTGLLAEVFVRRGFSVIGVEPNREMRLAGDAHLGQYPAFTSSAGAAEATGLDDARVDLVMAGQAFHWFDVDASRAECRRILKQSGQVALIWNERRMDTALLREYEALLDRYGVGYGGDIKQHVNPARLTRFFAGGVYQRLQFNNEQRFDLAGFKGRLTSSSYCPAPEHPNFRPIMTGLADLYDRHQQGGKVVLRYDTLAFLGAPG